MRLSYKYYIWFLRKNQIFISRIHQSQRLREWHGHANRIIWVKERQNPLTVDHLKWLVYYSDKKDCVGIEPTLDTVEVSVRRTLSLHKSVDSTPSLPVLTHPQRLDTIITGLNSVKLVCVASPYQPHQGCISLGSRLRIYPSPAHIKTEHWR